MIAPPPDLWAVVVLYHPEAELLRRQFEATIEQVAGIVYCDNGGGEATLRQLGLLGRAGVHRMGDGDNRGLAEALNIGLAWLIDRGGRFALLLDQDSVPEPGMVGSLHRLHLEAGAGPPVAAVGPAVFDALQGRLAPFGQARPLSRRLVPPPGTRDDVPFEVSYLITSGTVLSVAALRAIGLMESGLFIDSIDYEWCFRARARGHRLLATYGTFLRHRRGQRLQRTWAGVAVRIHPPPRLRSIYRNQVRLSFRGYVPWTWKVRSAIELAVRLAVFGLLVPGRAANLGAIGSGVAEGMRLGWRDLTAS
jgi:rhamnosyltransferase